MDNGAGDAYPDCRHVLPYTHEAIALCWLKHKFLRFIVWFEDDIHTPRKVSPPTNPLIHTILLILVPVP